MMPNLGECKIALVHDELTRRGGAEIVLEEMLRLWPHADVWALYAGRPVIEVDGQRHRVHTTGLQMLPTWFRRHPSRLLPLLPYAAEQIDLSGYDVVVSSASGFAKAVVTRATVPHVCYCHTTTRYLWDDAHRVVDQAPRLARWPAQAVLHSLRLQDFAAAQRVDVFLANSHWTRERISTYYRRASTVVYPPIDTAFFTPGPAAGGVSLQPKGYFLCVGRLTASKQFEQAIAACEKLKLPLIVVGTGHHRPRLAQAARRYTRFVGRVSAARLRDYYRGARALLQPGAEDFGMAAAEAQACGTPVVASGQGGAREVIRNHETGILYGPATVEGLAEAIRQFLAEEHTFYPELIQRESLRFGRTAFREAMQTAVASAIAVGPSSPV